MEDVCATVVDLFAVVAYLVAAAQQAAGAGYSVSATGCNFVLCRKPFRGNGVQLFGCGQCMPCRINKRRKWTARLLLECKTNDNNTFLTLTYAPEFLPEGGTLRPLDYKQFLEALRYQNNRKAVRYYVVGEYGDQTMRPHFHLLLFGIHHEQFKWGELWRKGFISAGPADIGSHNYVTGYVCKKMTNSKDERLKKLNGDRSESLSLHPEFARMSRRPGVGAAALKSIALELLTKVGSAAVASMGDIPNEIAIAGRSYPLDRWAKNEIRRHMGFPNLGSNSPGCQKAQERVQAVLNRETQTPPVPLPIMDPVVWRYVNLTEDAYNQSARKRAIYQKERPL